MKEITPAAKINISENESIFVGKNAKHIILEGAGISVTFNSWEELMKAIDISKASYVRKGEEK